MDIRKYAETVVKKGINVQKGQTVVISAAVEAAHFARLLTEYAYENGAKEVIVSWRDETISKLWYEKSEDGVFDTVHSWTKDIMDTNSKNGAAFISVTGTDPDLLKDIPQDKIIRYRKAHSAALEEHRDRMMSDQNRWCVVAIPIESWAKKVFPTDTTEVAMQKLWDAILTASRCDGKPDTVDWEKYAPLFESRVNYLTEKKLKSLHFKNSIGTDITLDLPAGHLWLGGGAIAKDGIQFMPNIPTEEIFTLPHKTGVNGKVVSSKPLNYNGQLIDNFWLKFENGKVVEHGAEIGLEALTSILEMDEGSRYLGEIALVPYQSPISQMNILFYNTLFDENASCHFALGRAYPTTIKGGDEMTPEQLVAAGTNFSAVHEDFMFGTADLLCTGTTETGEQITIFKDGNFVQLME